MGLKKGFDTKVYFYANNKWIELPTIGDLNYGSSKTDIPVQTKASNKVRSIPGMESCPITFTVLDGTDPADTTNTNAYDLLEQMYRADGDACVHSFCIGGTATTNTSNGGASGGIIDAFVCTNFATAAPLDGLRAADVTIAFSGLSGLSANVYKAQSDPIPDPDSSSGDEDDPSSSEDDEFPSM